MILAASTTTFVILGIIYVILLLTLGIMSIRKGHSLLANRSCSNCG